MTISSISLALGLFFIAPIGLTTWFFEKEQEKVKEAYEKISLSFTNIEEEDNTNL